MILLSDGAQRAYAPRDIAPQGPARRLADLGYPLYTLAFGQARGLGQARDVAIKDLSVNQTVYVKNELTVHGHGAGRRLCRTERSRCSCLMENAAGKMEPVGRRRAASAAKRRGRAIELHTVPQTPGEYKLTLRGHKQPGELVTTNNELSTFVTVLKGGVNVLYLEGTLRVDSEVSAPLARCLARHQGRLSCGSTRAIRKQRTGRLDKRLRSGASTTSTSSATSTPRCSRPTSCERWPRWSSKGPGW